MEEQVDKDLMDRWVDEVIRWFNEAPTRDQNEFLKCQKEDLISFHHSLGRNIRNRFNLWSRTWTEQIENGVDVSPDHPDAVSMRIIETVWERLHESKS